MTDDKRRIYDCSLEVERLLKQTYWAENRAIDIIKKSIENSLCYAIFDEEKDVMVAFARVITDYATTYYLCDVIVDEKYRKNGLGKQLVEWISNQEEKLKGQCGLLLTSDASSLYSKYGFVEFEEYCMLKF